MGGRLDREPALTDFMLDFAGSHLRAGWSIPEVDAAVRFMRARVGRGMPLGESLIVVYDLQRTGKLLPEDPEG